MRIISKHGHVDLPYERTCLCLITDCVMARCDGKLRKLWKRMDSVYDDYCYECGAYGDDYRVDENGNLVSNFADCPFNEDRSEDEIL